MTTKSESRGATVDWSNVELATEVKRTYFVKDDRGREFFKMYKPSEARQIFKGNKWVGKIVSTLDRSVLRKKNKT